MLTNIDVAILTKANELAERHGFLPSDFIATLQTSDSGQSILAYETAPDPDKDRTRRFEKMLDSIGVPHDGTLIGECEDIYAALTTALAKAPALRVRK